MKRIILPAAAMLTMALLLGGCTMDGEKIIVTDPPRVTSNVTSSPAPVTPEVTPNPPGAGSKPDPGNGLTSGSGLDQGSAPGGGVGDGRDRGGSAGSGTVPGGSTAEAKHTADPGRTGGK